MPLVHCSARLRCLLSVVLVLPVLRGSSAVEYRRDRLEVFRNVSWWFDHLRVIDVFKSRPSTKIAWVGDSTQRNQMQFLCDVLGSEYNTTLHGCNVILKGASFHSNVLIAGQEYGGKSAGWKFWQVEDQLDDYFSAISPSWDLFYFASTFLHQMKRTATGVSTGTFTKRDHFNLSTMVIKHSVDAAKKRGICPVFGTVNWICDEAFTGDYHKEARSFRHKHGSMVNWTRSEMDAETHSYHTLPLNSWGSDVAFEMELDAVSTLQHPLPVVDAYHITQHQCWATTSGDGRHYIPLLPNKIAAFGDAVAQCFGGNMIVD